MLVTKIIFHPDLNYIYTSTETKIEDMELYSKNSEVAH